ncbi:XrtA/PEP-CTERM system TPR-repeat protein PrsT [sulfur-oxidizing endosymbiont of Gigantopelta aegis]|uniref:XrtA/PEP-CTERM system TPR-repeat protein PrsT n=1 Tax=sulfur-oxidizing endosymbiont of Gigantopelta aegis TaxID=2794934 RepID=UPI0018DC7754|nr:XrtA/PEP-CTERM system TPR-repeat protein PrsT [sulfur-oxidizing endosymbiont of Gigantopelta aegis]
MNKKFTLICLLAGLNTGIYSSAIASTMEDAQQAYDKNDYPTATIHLKNQLKKSPKDAQARFLLGSIYLTTGKLQASLKELGRAHNIAPEQANIIFRYAEALQAAQKSDKVLEILNIPFNNPKDDSKRLSYRGFTYIAKNQLADAKQAFEQANAKQTSANAYNGLATLALLEKDYALATQQIEKSLSIKPDNMATIQLKAKLSNLNNDYESALKLYDQLVKKNPKNLSYRLERAATLTMLNKDQLAKKDLKIILDKIKLHPQANFIKAQILLREKDFVGAQKAAQQVVNVAPGHMPAAFILGAANFALGQYNQAEEYLTIYLSSNVQNLKAQNLLANVYLVQNKTKQALVILEGIPEQQLNNSPLLLVSLGNAYIQLNETEKGLQRLNQAQKLDPDNQNIRKRLIAAQFQSGELDSAIDELEQLATIQETTDNKTPNPTNYLLLISYIKNKQLDLASKKVSELLKKTPDDTKLLNIKALIEQLNGHTDKAIAQYQAIIKKDKDNIPAYMGLARVTALEKNWSESKKYFQQVLKINPKAIKAYLGLAAIAEKQKQPKKVEQYFFDAIEKNKDNIPSQLAIAGLLSRWYQSKKQPEKVLKLAEKLDKQHPNTPEIRSFLARAQLINKQQGRTERTLKGIITFDKKDLKHRLLLAKIISQDKSRINEAIDLLDDAQVHHPDYQSIYTLKAGLFIQQENYIDALAVASTMQREFPEVNTGLLLEADIYRAQNKFEKALPIYQAAYKKEQGKNKKVFAAIIDILIALKQKDEAIKLLSEEIKKSPDDLNSLFKLASLYHEKKFLDQAEIYYQLIIKKDPNHVIAINNLAWIMIDNDVKQAVILAKQAHDLAPDSAAIMDSYGYFLARDGQYPKAIELLKMATQGLPKDKDIQYHLAYTLHKMGKTDEAQAILKNIINSKEAFSEKEKAVELFQAIK